MSKFKSLFVALLLAVLPTASHAGMNHGISIVNITSGLSLQNVSGAAGYPYINFLKQATQGIPPAADGGPLALTADSYPVDTANLTTNISHIISLPASSSYAGNFIIGWNGTCSFLIDAGATNIVGTTGGAVITGHTSNLWVSGSTGTVTFNWPTGTPEPNMPFYFASTKPFTGCSGAYLIRADQQSLFNAGQIFQPEYLCWIKDGTYGGTSCSSLSLPQVGLNPKILRFMDWGSTNSSNVATYNYRPPTATAFTYTGAQFPLTALSSASGAAIGGTDNYTLPGYPDCPSSCTGAYQDGETFSGFVTNANTTTTYTGTQDNGAGITQLTGVVSTAGFTNGASITTSTGVYTAANVTGSTIDVVGLLWNGASSSGSVNVTPTVNVNGRGPLNIIYGLMSLPVGAIITAGEFATFSYNKNLNMVYMTPNGGLGYGAPYEVFVALANATNTDLWICIPNFLNDASITQLVTYVAANLHAGGSLHLEWANEVWPTGNAFNQSLYSDMAGMAAGYPLQINSYFLRIFAGNTFYGNQVIRVANLAKAAWTPRTASQLNIEHANQGFSLPLSAPSVQARFNGWFGGTKYAITGITNANGAVVTVPSHTFNPGDQVFIGGQVNNWYDNAPTNVYPTCGMTEIDKPYEQFVIVAPYTVHSVAGSNITLYDSTNTTPVNSTSWGTWGATGPTITITTSPTSGQTIWSVSGGHHLQQGDRIQFTGGTLPTGFFPNVTYYVSDINFTSTNFQLTRKQVGLNGPIVTATGSGSGTITLQQVGCNGGSISVIPSPANSPAGNAQYLAEANYYNGAQFSQSTTNPSVMTPANIGVMAGTGQLFNQAYNYVNGNSTQQAAALAFMDNDTRVGVLPPDPITSNCPATPAVFTTPMPVNFYATNGFGLTNGQGIQFASTGTLPTGIAANTIYRIINQSGNTFQIGAANGIGGALACTGAGSGQLQVVTMTGSPINGFTAFTGSGAVYTPFYQQWGQQAAIWGNIGVSNYEGGFQEAPPTGATLLTPTASSFIATVDNGSGGAGNTLHVSTVAEGFLAVGQNIPSITGNPTITAYITGTGNIGTYTISGTAQLIASSTNMQSNGDFYNPPYAYGGDVVIPTPATTAACTWTTTNPHNLVAGNAVILTSTNHLPTGFLNFTPYYVVTTNLTTTTFCLATTPGGSAITPTANSAGTVTFSEDAADLYILLQAYKNSSLFQQLVTDQITQFQAGVASGGGGTGANIFGWYGDIGINAPGSGYGSPWTLCRSDEYQPCYKSFDAIKAYN